MARTQLTATLPDGKVATRTTARNYLYVVACDGYTPNFFRRLVANHMENIRRCEGIGAKVYPAALEEVERLKKTAADHEASPRPASWGVLTWCGRYDLAEKAANQYRNEGYRNVTIIKVN